jgi:hypothetical protein
MSRWIVTGIALGVILARPLVAQARDRLSFDATVGPSLGSGGKQHYLQAGDVAGELTLAFRSHPDGIVTPLTAISAGRRSPAELGGDAKCVVAPGDTACSPSFPAFGHVGLLGGIELRDYALTLRALAGPARYGAGGVSGWGGQFHVDGAIGFTHIELVAAARESLVSSSVAGTLHVRSLEFGLRVQ